MFRTAFARPVSGRASARRNLSIGTALGGPLALALLALPGAAMAQDECGAPPAGGGTVTCSPDGNPYPNGLFYIAPDDLTIVLEDGVVIDTSGSLNPGILAITGSLDGTLTVDGGTNTSITTDADGGFGALIASNNGAIDITLDQITTTGTNAGGILASSSEGDVSVTVNDISTAGDGANGIDSSTDISSITIDARTITTAGAGANGIIANSDFGDIDITADTISTSGDASGFLNPGANGILATTGGIGTVTVDAGDITTTGIGGVGIRTETATGLNSVTVDSVTTSGANADGVSVVSSNGMAMVDAGTISTTGAGADGIVATGNLGADVSFDSITTTGDNAVGVLIPAGGFFGPRPTTTATITGGDITTSGLNSDGIRAVASTGTIGLALGGDIATSGDNARGIFVTAPGGVTIAGAGNVSTTGDNANAVDVSSTTGAIDVTLGDVSAAGSLSGGVRAIGGTDSDVTLLLGDVTTTGLEGSSFFFLPNSTAVYARAIGTGNLSVSTGDVSTLGLGARGIDAAAAGDVNVVSGAVSTDGDNAPAINAESTDGNVSVISTGVVSTTGDSSNGINATSFGGNVTVDARDTVGTAGFNSDGILATTVDGDVAVAFTNVATNGTFAEGVTATSTGGNVAVSGGGVTVGGQATAALIATSDTGDVSVTTTGDVRATGRGGSGIFASSTTGDVVVNAANVSTVSTLEDDRTTSRAAIVATGANATVNSTGMISMAGVAEFGGEPDAVVVTATDGNGRAVVNNVTSSGEGSRAVVVTATDDALVGVTGLVQARGLGADAVSVTGDTARVTVASGGQITAVDGNLITITSATSSSIENAGTLGPAANGYTIEAIGGPIGINNSGTLSSDILLTANNDRITNSGTFLVSTNPDFGAGADFFVNSGIVEVGRNATAAGTSTFTGLETFQNTGGLVELRNGIAGDRLILPGTFDASGDSRLGLDIMFGSPTVNDRLVLGGAASGNTTVLLNSLGSGQATFDPGNVILVQAGAASNVDAFDLDGGFIEQGFVRSEIIYNPADFTFRLSGGASDAAFRTLNYVEGARNLWLKSADVVSGQLRAQRDALWAYGGGEPSPRLWMQIHGSVETRESSQNVVDFGQNRVVGTGFEQDYFGGQLGLDLGGGVGDKGGFAVGVTGGYINSSLNFAGSPDRVTFDAVNAGVYASFTSGNVFINGLAKYDYYWADAISPTAGFRQDFQGQAYGGRLEAGLRFGSDTFFIEPAASVSYVKTDFDDFSVFGTQVQFDEEDGFRGRAGARIGGQLDMFGSKAAFYLGGNYVHEFQGEDAVRFTSGGQTLTYVNGRPEDYGEAILGLSVGQSNGVSGFIEGSYIRSFSDDDFGRLPIEGAGGRAGLRIRF